MRSMNEAEYRKILQERLTPKRYNHSLEVAKEAKRLAIKYNCDAEKAYLAGLLHDITKNTPDEKQLQIMRDFDIILSDVEFGAKKLWHAITGAAYVQNVLKIDDSEIISAIRFHTTAKEDMSLLEKVLYLADFTSADRDYDDVDVMRSLVDISLQDALKYALCYTMKDLVNRDLPVHPDTLKAYNQILLFSER